MSYIINKNTLFLEKNDQLIDTFICEKNNKIFINDKINNIINNSCMFYGSSYNGRKQAIKKIIKNASKLPIIIKENEKIIVFSLKSDQNLNNTWFIFNNIKTYRKIEKNVEVVFINNICKTINCSFYTFHQQYIKSCILYAILSLRNS